MMKNNLFIQRRFQVQRDEEADCVNFIGSLYIAYYFYKNNELYVSKYALCIKITKSISEITHLLGK